MVGVMETLILIQTLVSGLLIGFIFSLIAVGLTLIFGVMEIVNFAHGEFLMLAMYIAYWLYAPPPEGFLHGFSLDPLFATPLCAAVLFGVGVLTYKTIIARILDAPMLAQIFATFGLMVFMRSAAQFLWTPDYRLVKEPLLAGRVDLGGIFIGLPQLVASLGAIVTTGFVYWFITKTELGTALRATAEDKEAAVLMGINTEWMYTLAWGIGAACVGVAGGLLAMFYYIYPEVGSVFALTAFVIVALGGFGSITGAFVAGILIGLVETLSGLLGSPAFKLIPVYVIYLGVVLLRPKGLFGEF